KPLFNGSDNLLLTNFIDKALGCQPFMAPNLADNGAMATSLGLNELQAPLQAAPVALIPPNNPMVTVDGQQNLAKENLYRSGVTMPAATGFGTDAVDYCRQMMAGADRIIKDAQAFRDTASPDTGAAVNLYAFLGSRLSGSYDELGCSDLLGAPNPVQIQ